MSEARRDQDYLADIVEAIQRIRTYIEGLSLDDYLTDYKTQDAVLRNLEVIGEAVKNLSDELKAANPRTPWKEMAGVRDRLIHHYFGVNNEIVWQIVQGDLPGLLPQIESIQSQYS